ncbi:hypothetical protein HBH56_025340 [Parastagonospora nodorum]|nr:hypothetical protein HBH56_025340 [Parastagonospora nodorum]KAH3934607.1 hypothetical protein HBH54_056670 [Parastagonospora nodorum]KAH3949581.1 hypothetical protein HBH53_084360 [Parastagonospora nodorum]KAH4141585.1 hypothetical protein HBH45_060080 [Parastagonospora nodorum]KAH4161558.1 hypothetical protein HBH44_093670 [Parastagonospora nodorum]
MAFMQKLSSLPAEVHACTAKLYYFEGFINSGLQDSNPSFSPPISNLLSRLKLFFFHVKKSDLLYTLFISYYSHFPLTDLLHLNYPRTKTCSSI